MKLPKGISLRTNKNGTQTLIIRVMINGTARQKTLNVGQFRTVKQAVIEAEAIRLEMSKAIYEKRISDKQEKENPTVREMYETAERLWSETIKTKQRHNYFFNKIAAAGLSDKPLKDITSEEIQDCINDYAATHKATQSSHMLSIWREIYKAASFRNISIADKTAAVKLPKDKHPEQKTRPVYITAEQIDEWALAMLQYNSGTAAGRYKARTMFCMLCLCYYAGIRPAEAMGLMWGDYDANAGTLSIKRACGADGSEINTIIPTKTEQSRRIIPVDENLAKELYLYRQYITKTRPAETPYILTSETGRLFDIDDVSGYFCRVSRKCGIRLTPYMMRHRFATDLINTDGISLRTVQELMGHASPSTTLSYARATSSDAIDAIANRVKQ